MRKVKLTLEDINKIANRIVEMKDGYGDMFDDEDSFEDGAEITEEMWDMMNDCEREDALLTAIDDPDDVDRHIDSAWYELPSDVRDYMTFSYQDWRDYEDCD